MGSVSVVAFCLIFFSSLVHSFAEFTAEDCWSLGLNKANLLCSSCDQLSKFDLNELKDHCKQCCHKDESADAVKRYPKARLEVCTCKFGAYPQIQAFVKSDRPDKFPNLNIRYVRGLDPVIKLLDEDSNIQEVLAIEKWDTDTVEEFLRTHLIPPEELSDKNDYLKTNMV
ncbi:selenoprotein F [Thrips palmi]|uniref:Selenoprotein F n=1 Tax=Thrips palmi TaxID=161013 RepID=A0A6P8ZI40_THRPL|nr:selenoprotein F [Thrips palmi]